MRLHDLAPANGSTHRKRRIGRGNASGTGTTAGKGTKGQKARSGGSNAFYRGMSSRMQRYGKLPGFRNRWRTEYFTVTLSDLNRFPENSIIDSEALRKAGVIRGKRDLPVKLVATGELTVPVTVRIAKATSGARVQVEARGGSLELTEISPPTSTSNSAT